MEKKIGIWLDSEKAFVITVTGNDENIKEIASNMDHFKIHGGSGTSTPYQSQDATSDSKLLEKKKHQQTKYFNDIISVIKDASSIVVFGPAQTKIAFQTELKNNAILLSKLIAVEPADGNLTKNQLKELVREFYKKN